MPDRLHRRCHILCDPSRMRLGVAVVSVVAPLTFAAAPATAHECRVKTPEEYLAHASTAFVGRVVARTPGDPREVTFQITERLKGAEAEETVRVRVPTGKSLPDFSVDASFLVFAQAGPDGALVLRECSGTIETSLPAAFATSPPETRAAYERDLAATLDRVRAARPAPRPPAEAPADGAARNDSAASTHGPHFGGVHLLGGLGVGTGVELRAAVEAGALLSFGSRPQSTRDGWSYGTTQGLVVGLAWSQGLDRLRGEAYGEVGWAIASGYAGLVAVAGPAVRLFRDQAGGVSARACGWAMALELCFRATGTFVERRDASALLLLGFGIN